MLAWIFASIWFGYRANRANRNMIGWGFAGVLTFGIMKVLVGLMAVNSSVSSQEEANTLLIFLNCLLFGGTFLLGFLIQPRPESFVNGSTSKEAEAPA